jgi:hypothetical protein
MHSRNEPRARHTVLAAAVATVTLVASFGSVAHADDDPVTEPPAEAAEGVVVAVGPPPVPPVAPPPVPATTVVVVAAAVAAPPVPPTTAAVAVVAPPVPPTTVAAAPRVQSYAAVQSPQLADVERIADVIVDVGATVHAGLALIDSRL